MHDVGMNMSQLAMSVKQVDDTIELAHEFCLKFIYDQISTNNILLYFTMLWDNIL